jgi:uncharacterized protein YecT (DUF1311 family)
MRVVIVLGLAAIASMTTAKAENCGAAATQTGMNVCEDKNYRKADAELNSIYRQITDRLKSDDDLRPTLEALVAAQRAWIAFRDAECAFVGSRTAGGSVNGAIVASCLAGVTGKRTKELRAYLKCKEGDLACPVPANN